MTDGSAQELLNAFRGARRIIMIHLLKMYVIIRFKNKFSIIQRNDHGFASPIFMKMDLSLRASFVSFVIFVVAAFAPVQPSGPPDFHHKGHKAHKGLTKKAFSYQAKTETDWVWPREMARSHSIFINKVYMIVVSHYKKWRDIHESEDQSAPAGSGCHSPAS